MRLREKIDCAKWWLTGSTVDENGQVYNYRKAILCEKEWCPECGRKNSRYHKRKMNRWRKKVMSMPSLGYLVITVPEQARFLLQTRKALEDLRTYWKRKMIRCGYKTGLIRYHWAGDKNPRKWHPHLNILINSKFLDKRILKQWRQDYRKWLHDYTKIEIPVVDINYHYRIDQRGREKILRYVTRATMIWYEPGLAGILKGFRNMVSWGKRADWIYQMSFLPSKRERDMTYVDQIMAGICPITGKKINWTGRERIQDKIPGIYQEIAVTGVFVDESTWQKLKSILYEIYSKEVIA